MLAGALFILLAVMAPGVAIQRLLRLRIDPALVIPAGTGLCAAACWLSLVSATPWLFPALLTGLGAACLLVRTPWQWADGPSLRGALPFGLVLVAFLTVTQYPWNRQDRSGAFLLDPLVTYDTAFHVGVARELDVGYPPQVPGLSGFPLGYHLGADLVRTAALRFAGVDPYDSISRLDVTLWALALALALRGVMARLQAPALAVAMIPWTLLLTDFSYLFAWTPGAHWWADLLKGNLLVSLCYANPIVPALGLTLAALIALARAEAGESSGYALMAALLAAAVPFFKVFLGAHLLLGLGVAFVVCPAARRRLALVAAPLALGTAALVLGQGGATVQVALAPLDIVHTPEGLGVDPFGGPLLVMWTLSWILASFGVRIVGLPRAWRSLRAGDAVAAALATMALGAWPLGLLFRVSAPEAFAGQQIINDATYLVEQGGPLLWIFTAWQLAVLAQRRRWAAALLIALAVPSSVQYLVKKAVTPPDALPPAMVRAMRALEAVSSPGDVVLQRAGARWPPAPVILIGRRVPFERFTPYLTQFASRADLERRHQTVVGFLRTRDPEQARALARELSAKFVCLYGGDRVRFPPAELLIPIHEEPDARCYRLR